MASKRFGTADRDDLLDKLDTAVAAVQDVIDLKHPRMHLEPVLSELRLRRRRVAQAIVHHPGQGAGGV